MKTYNKLVRDKMPEVLDKIGAKYTERIASDTEYKAELIKKLVEEAKEFAEAGEPMELADVMEVVAAIRKLPRYKDVEKLRKKKLQERGGFTKKLILKGKHPNS